MNATHGHGRTIDDKETAAFSLSPLGNEAHRFVEGLLSADGPALEVLEIGCATGVGVAEWARRFPKTGFSGVDLSEQAIASARAASQQVRWHAGDYMEFDGGRYDILCSESTLQYIPGEDAVLAQKLARDLAPGGKVIVTMPVDCLWNRVMIRARKILWGLRSIHIDRAILWLGRTLHPDWAPEALAERLRYLYVPTYRLDGPDFVSAMARAGLVVEHRQHLADPSVAKLKHTLVVFRGS